MNDAQLIDKLGGVTAVARLLGLLRHQLVDGKLSPLIEKSG